MSELKKTQAQQRKAMQLAIARSAICQLTALNKTLAQAEAVGVIIDISCSGYGRKSPEVTAIYDTTTNRYHSLYKEAFE